MRIEPLRLEARLDSRLWGGERLGAWMGLAEAPARLAEAWLVYDQNLISSGPFAGRSLAQAAQALGAELVGTRSFQRSGAEFPLMAKLIDAEDRLSVQVHPDDAFARQLEAESGFQGKTEAWHILESRPGADVYLGFSQEVDRARVEAAALDGSLPRLLRSLELSPGDTVLVPARTVHAINGGLLLFEIQQRSDLTYRLFDYDRRGPDGKPRPLHLERALQVADLARAPGKVQPRPGSAPFATRLVCCDFFGLDRWELTEPVALSTVPETFEILSPVEGQLTLGWAQGSLRLGRGEAVVLPAALGEYSLTPTGTARLLRAFVP